MGGKRGKGEGKRKKEFGGFFFHGRDEGMNGWMSNVLSRYAISSKKNGVSWVYFGKIATGGIISPY